jgi:hypothetical protein
VAVDIEVKGVISILEYTIHHKMTVAIMHRRKERRIE